MELFRPYPVLRQVIVNTKTGRSFRGVLWARKGGYLVLRNAEALQTDGKIVAVDGEALVPDSEVEFVQVLNP